jgi:uncharacterized protein (TIGR00369 family)
MLQPPDPEYRSRIESSFARQAAMRLIGARVLRIEPGVVELGLDFRPDLTQQHGYLHAGVVSMIADSAGGYAGFTMMPADASVLTVEFKLNLLAPAIGERFVARGEVLKAGRNLVVTRGEVRAFRGASATLCAVMQQTLATMHGRPDAATA